MRKLQHTYFRDRTAEIGYSHINQSLNAINEYIFSGMGERPGPLEDYGIRVTSHSPNVGLNLKDYPW